jgi:NADH dehydrogenase
VGKSVKIVIIGGGFGGIYAFKSMHKLFHKKSAEIVLINEKNYFLFTPMLHEVATGGINPLNIIEPIREVISCCPNNFYLGKAEEVNLENKTVLVDNHHVNYDYLVLAPGSETNFYTLKEEELKNCFTLKSINDAIKLRNHIISKIECASHTSNIEQRNKKITFVVVGGGATGVELAAELEEFIIGTFSKYYDREMIKNVRVILIERGKELVTGFGPKIRERSLKVLSEKGIQVLLNTEVKSVTDSKIILGNDNEIQTETVVWVAGVKPASLKFRQDVLKTESGKLVVNEYLQLENHKNVFALGDVASFMQNGSPLPALAQVAEKESTAVARNIYLLSKEKNPERFVYKHSGNLLSVGRWMALGEIYNFTFGGKTIWWLWRTVYLFKMISFRKKN